MKTKDVKENKEKVYLKTYDKLTEYLSTNPKIPVKWIKCLQIGDSPALYEIIVWDGEKQFGFTISPIKIYDNIWTNECSKLTYTDFCGKNIIWDSKIAFDKIYNKKAKKNLLEHYGKSFELVIKEIKQTSKKLDNNKNYITYKDLLNYQTFMNICRKKEIKKFMKEQQNKQDITSVKSEINKIYKCLEM